MSAFAGLCFFDERPVDAGALCRMVSTLAYRGPDGSSVWSRGSVGLAQTSFLTTLEARAEQLAEILGTTLVVVADARLDNRDELIALLEFDRPATDVEDSELVGRAYQKWGDASAIRLLGDFAFAVWDPDRRRFFCARDPFGVKPLYYYRSDRLFAFASQISPLFSIPEVPRTLNEMKVAHYLLPTLEDQEITFYKDVVRLPPASSMTVDGNGARVRTYWALDPAHESRDHSDREYAEGFRELFTDAVRCRLRAKAPIGAMLSGGLDSSSVVCVASDLLGRQSPQPLHTFSAIFPERPECDERRFADLVVQSKNLTAHYLRCDRVSPLSALRGALWAQDDQPLSAPNCFMFETIARAARKEGVRVLLDGVDGDTIVSHGLGYLAELASAWRWRALAREVDQLGKHFSRSRWKMLWAYGLKPNVPRPVRNFWLAARGRGRLVRLTNPTVSQEFVDRLNLRDRLAESFAVRAGLPRTARQDQWFRLAAPGYSSAFELFDRAAATFPLEIRHPFFDRRLVEFCLALPPEQKLRDGWTRSVMRRGLAETLPHGIRWRGGKTYLDTNFVQNFIGFERRVLDAFVRKPPRPVDAYIDAAALRRVYRRCISTMDRFDAMTIWKALTLGRWLDPAGLTLE